MSLIYTYRASKDLCSQPSQLLRDRINLRLFEINEIENILAQRDELKINSDKPKLPLFFLEFLSCLQSLLATHRDKRLLLSEDYIASINIENYDYREISAPKVYGPYINLTSEYDPNILGYHEIEGVTVPIIYAQKDNYGDTICVIPLRLKWSKYMLTPLASQPYTITFAKPGMNVQDISNFICAIKLVHKKVYSTSDDATVMLDNMFFRCVQCEYDFSNITLANEKYF